MLKLCQLMETFWLDWMMVRAAGALEMLADPAWTAPPMGRANPSETRVMLKVPARAVA